MDIVSIQLQISPKALYLRLSDSLEEMVESGQIKDSERLPPIRKLASQLNLSISTVIAAYQYLENKGLVYSKKGSGTYVLPQNRIVMEDDVARDALPQYDNLYIPHDAINLAGSTPGSDMFPTEDFKVAINGVLDTEGGNAFTYQESEGYEGLRTELAIYVNDAFSTDRYRAEDILITSGAQQAIDLISKVLIRPNDVVLVENPSYIGAGSTFKSRGAKIIGVPMEEDGINLDVLKYYVQRYQPRFLYTIPVYHTPTGVCLSGEKRKELLQLADKHNFFILEEDINSDLNLEGEKILPLKSEDTYDRVIYVKSFSKIFMPGIRTGFMIAPRSISHDLANAKYITDISTSGLIQRSLCNYFQSGSWRDHLKTISKTYRERMEAAYASISSWESKGVSFKKPKGGFGFWLKLPEKIKDHEMHDLCLSNLVLVAKGSNFYISPMHGYDQYLRVSYATSGIGEIEAGLKIIENCLNILLERKTKRSFLNF